MGFGGLFTNDNSQHSGFSMFDTFKPKPSEGVQFGVVKEYIGSVDDGDITGGIVVEVEADGPFTKTRDIKAYPANPNSLSLPAAVVGGK